MVVCCWQEVLGAPWLAWWTPHPAINVLAVFEKPFPHSEKWSIVLPGLGLGVLCCALKFRLLSKEAIRRSHDLASCFGKKRRVFMIRRQCFYATT